MPGGRDGWVSDETDACGRAGIGDNTLPALKPAFAWRQRRQYTGDGSAFAIFLPEEAVFEGLTVLTCPAAWAKVEAFSLGQIMKRFPAKPVIALIALLVLLVTGQGLAANLVLCIGEDGHSAFEQAVAGRCAPVQPSGSGEDGCTCAVDSHDHCGTCDDFSISHDSLHSRFRGDQEQAPPLTIPALAAAPCAPTLFIRDLTANLSPQPPPDPDRFLLALRTTVLLI